MLDASFSDLNSSRKHSLMRSQSGSFYGRESAYRATLYDRLGGNSKLSKQAKVDLVVRDLYVSILA